MLELHAFARADLFLERALAFLEIDDAANGFLTSAALAAPPDDEGPGRRWILATREGRPAIAALAVVGGRVALSAARAEDARALGALLAPRLRKGRARASESWRALGPAPATAAFASGWGGGEAGPPELRQILMRLDLRPDLRLAGGSEAPAPGAFRRARREDARLLRSWMRAFDEETGALESQPPAEAWVEPAIARGDAFVWEVEGRIVGTASVGGRTRRGGRIHLVYAPPEARRRGFAAACVRALTRALRAEGKTEASLFADARSSRDGLGPGAAATGARALYAGLGFEPTGEFTEIELS